MYNVVDLSDYKDHKLTESNVGFQLLQKAGWTEGQGLGEKEDGIKDPINQCVCCHENRNEFVVIIIGERSHLSRLVLGQRGLET